MRRRAFVLALGGAMTSPRGLRAQQTTMPVIGFLSLRAAIAWSDLLAAFRQGLAEAGFVEGQNVAIEYRWAENDADRLPALAANLVGQQVAVIVATGGALPIRAGDAGDQDDTHRFHQRRGSGRGGFRCRPEPTGRQCHRSDLVHQRAAKKAGAVTA